MSSSKETDIGGAATKEANKRVLEEEEEKEAGQQKKRKVYSSYTDTDRAAIGRYAAEHGNIAAQRDFKSKLPDLGESTIRSFKKKYLAALSKGESVDKIPSMRHGRPLTLGELDKEVQSYVRALRRAGTPVTLPVI